MWVIIHYCHNDYKYAWKDYTRCNGYDLDMTQFVFPVKFWFSQTIYGIK